ncbi:MAG: type I-E CRISPR-associated protein Cas7/Cse4/CasC, partial [Neofamilia sp.]
YGGVRRARVSSQSWKKAIRDYFNANSEQTNVGVRTLNIVEYVAGKIQAIDSSINFEDSLKLANDVINKAGVTTKDYKAKALFFLGETQGKELAQAAIDGISDKKILENILRNNPAIDIALFGRMVADDPSLNEDASCQVAHAISTHAIQSEFDFFTAVDDLAPEDNAGAGMLGTVEYNSSTLYRYANVAIHSLLRQLNSKQATIDSLKLFIESFSNSMPTGKINTFANQTLPQAILISLRNDRPVSLVSAFEEPVKSTEGYVEKSVIKLFKEYERVQKFVNEPLFTAYLILNENGLSIELEGETINLSTLLDEFREKLEELLPNTEGEL